LLRRYTSMLPSLDPVTTTGDCCPKSKVERRLRPEFSEMAGLRLQAAQG
jgi:hypothetical protein